MTARAEEVARRIEAVSSKPRYGLTPAMRPMRRA